MKNYSDLQAIDPCLHLKIEFEKIGAPKFLVTINNQTWESPDSITYNQLKLLSEFDIQVLLYEIGRAHV